MAKVTTLFKVMPVDNEVDLDRVEEDLRESLNVEDVEREDVAFGLQALMVLAQLPEETGTEYTQEEIEDIEGVKTVDIESVTRE